MPFWTRDWLDSKELRRCSPGARGTLADLMAIAHEGYPYGYLADKVGALTESYLAARCVVSVDDFRAHVAELKACGERVAVNEAGIMYIPRLVEDAATRKKKSEAGKRGGNPKLLKGKDKREVKDGAYPSAQPHYDYDSVSDFQIKNSGSPETESLPSARFEEVWARWPRKTGKDAAAMDWTSVVTEENEDAVLACADRYLRSQEVAERKVRNLGSTIQKTGWLIDCARDNWECDWPAATSQRRQSTTEAMCDRAREILNREA